MHPWHLNRILTVMIGCVVQLFLIWCFSIKTNSCTVLVAFLQHVLFKLAQSPYLRDLYCGRYCCFAGKHGFPQFMKFNVAFYVENISFTANSIQQNTIFFDLEEMDLFCICSYQTPLQFFFFTMLVWVCPWCCMHGCIINQ